MTEKFNPKTILTYQLLKSIIEKVEYWINAEHKDKEDEAQINYYECDSFIYDKLNFPEYPLLTINKKINETDNAKIWYAEEYDIIQSNIESTAEENLALYIELERLVVKETSHLEKQLFKHISEELNDFDLQETIQNKD